MVELEKPPPASTAAELNEARADARQREIVQPVPAADANASGASDEEIAEKGLATDSLPDVASVWPDDQIARESPFMSSGDRFEALLELAQEMEFRFLQYGD